MKVTDVKRDAGNGLLKKDSVNSAIREHVINSLPCIFRKKDSN